MYLSCKQIIPDPFKIFTSFHLSVLIQCTTHIYFRALTQGYIYSFILALKYQLLPPPALPLQPLMLEKQEVAYFFLALAVLGQFYVFWIW